MAVRWGSTSKKIQSSLARQRANQIKKAHHIAFFWFFSFAKEKNTHPPRPASPRILSRPPRPRSYFFCWRHHTHITNRWGRIFAKNR